MLIGINYVGQQSVASLYLFTDQEATTCDLQSRLELFIQTTLTVSVYRCDEPRHLWNLNINPGSNRCFETFFRALNSSVGSIMTKAAEYVNHMYSLYKGRAAITVGVNSELNSIHPFVFENISKVPIGLIALSADDISNPTDVDIYHISSFIPGNGQGTEIMNFLCKTADELGVRLCIQAEVQFNGNQTMTNPQLIDWYHTYGFTGNRIMHREPNA